MVASRTAGIDPAAEQPDIGVVRTGYRPRRGDHLVALRGEIRYEMAPNKAIGACHQHTGAIIHLSQDLQRRCG